MPLEPFDQTTIPVQPVAVNAKVLGEQTTFVVGVLTVGEATLQAALTLIVISLLVAVLGDAQILLLVIMTFILSPFTRVELV